MTTATAPQPFQIKITDSELDDLHRRLDTTRWPEPAPDARTDFARGVPLPYLQELTSTGALKKTASIRFRSSLPRSTGSRSTTCTSALRSRMRCRC
jgi:hypothetical protein